MAPGAGGADVTGAESTRAEESFEGDVAGVPLTVGTGPISGQGAGVGGGGAGVRTTFGGGPNSGQELPEGGIALGAAASPALGGAALGAGAQPVGSGGALGGGDEGVAGSAGGRGRVAPHVGQ